MLPVASLFKKSPDCVQAKQLHKVVAAALAVLVAAVGFAVAVAAAAVVDLAAAVVKVPSRQRPSWGEAAVVLFSSPLVPGSFDHDARYRLCRPS